MISLTGSHAALRSWGYCQRWPIIDPMLDQINSCHYRGQANNVPMLYTDFGPMQ